VTNPLALPSGTDLTILQQRQIRAITSGSIVIEKGAKSYLTRGVEYPLHFLDFEAARPPVPTYPGQQPYALIPFQWSCHVLPAPNAPLQHFEFLARNADDPRRALTESLVEALHPEGSIVVYSGFEQEVIRSMAGLFPDLAPSLDGIAARLFDLLPAVRRHFYHPDFGASFSIKSILPVLVPGQAYEDLEISEGMEAVWAYHRLLSDELEPDERDRLVRDLLDYCRQDSFAMVEVYQALLALVNDGATRDEADTVQ